ncbi:MAG: YchJ family metal-binding protein [Rubrivivax sp.]
MSKSPPRADPTLAPCPCGRPRSTAACCGRWHADPAAAPDAESLMRARYSAHVLGRAEVLLATWAPETRPTRIEPDPPGLRWLGLDVRAHRVLDADHATVEFVARHRVDGRATRLHERSRFERRDGVWLYVDGDRLD